MMHPGAAAAPRSRLIADLRAWADPEHGDRAALATLRRGLGKRPGEAAELFPLIVPRLPRGLSIHREADHYLVASLFAWHPMDLEDGVPAWERNLGASMKRLATATDNDGPERRFAALLNSDREDLPERLRHVVGLLRAHAIPIDWERLLDDLGRWEFSSRIVQKAWATAFWGE